jgi:hypothetical protein
MSVTNQSLVDDAAALAKFTEKMFNANRAQRAALELQIAAAILEVIKEEDAANNTTVQKKIANRIKAKLNL